MANVVVVGSQWGDEGKGKIVDWLSEQADIVVRFQGGHNAGHTLVIDGVTYKLSLLPSGVVRPGKLSVIGNGVVLDPHALIEEIDRLDGQGVNVTPESLRIAENATLILPLHQELDAIRESASALTRIGTTRRGIGPAYEDKVGRRAIRLMDLADLPALNGKIERLLAHHNALRRGLGLEEIAAARHLRRARQRRAAVLPYMDSVWSLLDQKRREGKRILFEGAQGALLDIDHGTYPFVTSSNTVAAQAATGSGLGPCAIGYVLGICKAYTTRVGEGPFPTEQKNEIGRLIGERGREFGTVTGRPRRCGWFDAVLVRQTVRTSGINGLALTKLDILDGFKEIKVCVGYRLDGREIDYLPASEHAQAAGRAGLRDGRGLAGADRPGPVLGGSAGAGDQVCAPDRGTGRLPGGLAVDQPGARGHDSDAEPVRELKLAEFASANRVSSEPMADYYPLISPRRRRSRKEQRRDPPCALRARARGAGRAVARRQLRRCRETDITRERLALEESIRKVEAEAARQFDPSRAAAGAQGAPARARTLGGGTCAAARAGRAFAGTAVTAGAIARPSERAQPVGEERAARGGATAASAAGAAAAGPAAGTAHAGRGPLLRHRVRPAAAGGRARSAGRAAAPSVAPAGCPTAARPTAA